MKFRVTHVFDAPLEIVLESREARYTELEKIPDLKSVQEIEKQVEGDIVKSKRESSASSLVPAPFRKFISPDMLKWVEESEWNIKTHIHKWRVKPILSDKHKNKQSQEFFECTGKTEYKEFEDKGIKKTRRTLEGELNVKVPVFGKIAENGIIEAFKKNFGKDNNAIWDRAKKLMKKDK